MPEIVDIEIHWHCGQGYFHIERIKGMGVVRVAIGFITAASISSCISFQNRRNAVTGSPFPR